MGVDETMSKTPVEWISIGAGVIVLTGLLLIGLGLTVFGMVGLFQFGIESDYTTGYLLMLAVGVILLAIPTVLYVLGRVTGRTWRKIVSRRA